MFGHVFYLEELKYKVLRNYKPKLRRSLTRFQRNYYYYIVYI
jgi:hypothetical protein